MHEAAVVREGTFLGSRETRVAPRAKQVTSTSGKRNRDHESPSSATIEICGSRNNQRIDRPLLWGTLLDGTTSPLIKKRYFAAVTRARGDQRYEPTTSRRIAGPRT